jgi:hypothetical protein
MGQPIFESIHRCQLQTKNSKIVALISVAIGYNLFLHLIAPSEGTLRMTEKVTASSIRIALEKRYQAPEWCLLHEVANGTGLSAKRYADCIAMNLFPSRGLAIHGIEIKVSRSDLLNELKQPEKADEIAQYCDYWYVASPKGLADGVELPMTWGLLELFDSGILREKKKAEKLVEAKPLTRQFVAALARRINQLDATTIAELAEQRIKPERERLQREADELRVERRKYPSNLPELYSNLKSDVERLEQTIGFRITDQWDNSIHTFCKAAELVRSTGLTETYGGIIGLRNTLRSKLQHIEETLGLFGLDNETEE